MCIENMTGVSVAESDMTAYKVVRLVRGQYRSQYESRYRATQFYGETIAGTKGRVFRYQLGKPKVSRFGRTEGVYLFVNFEDAKRSIRFSLDPHAILECAVPKGTKFKRGRTPPTASPSSAEALLVEEATPRKECPNH